MSVKKQFHRIGRQASAIGWPRLARLFLVSVLLWSALLPLAGWINNLQNYQLSAATETVIGSASQNLSQKFTYDAANNQWQFNKDGSALEAAAIAKQQGSKASDVSSALAQLQAKVGGAGKKDVSLYSVDLPVDSSRGITYYDNTTNLSFTMTPQLKLGEGHKQQGRIVYPFADGGKLVYTAKNNGLKEDIVLSHNIGDALSYSYQLNLPKTLEAHIAADGSVGIYSADPVLFGNVSTGSDMDQAKLESARESAKKDHLLFAVPAPVIKDASGVVAKAAYQLNGSTLSVSATGLNRLSYPLSIDPSVVVTSTSDFASGNSDSNIDFSTSGQVQRADETGATLSGGWTSSSGAATIGARYGMQTEIYNNYIYVMGGVTNGPTWNNDVYYAVLNSNGSLGTWTATASFATARSGFASEIYNGYMYIAGGKQLISGNYTYYSDVQYAKLTANGPIATDSGCGSAWCSTTSLAMPISNTVNVAYDGYFYVIGGYDGTSYYSTVQYAKFQGDGTLSAWTTTTSLSAASAFGQGVTYNNYLYVLGGLTTGGTNTSLVRYAQINSDGTLGAWNTTTSLPNARQNFMAIANNGYIYFFGGQSGGATQSDAYYGMMRSDGTIRDWQSTTSMPAVRGTGTIVTANNYLYITGGSDGASSYYDSTLYAKVDPPGTLSSQTSRTALSGTNIGTGRQGALSIINNGCIYEIGGYNGTNYQLNIYYATLAADGSFGSWTTSTRSLGTAVGYFGMAFYNRYLYVVGGLGTSGTAVTTVQYAPFANTGCGFNANWATTTAYPGAVANQAATAYDGYIYMIGSSTSGSGAANTLYSSPVSSTGTLGSWTSQAYTLNTSRLRSGLLAYNGYLYAVGGSSGSAALTSVEYAPIDNAGNITGAWTAANSLGTARLGLGTVIHSGYLYAIGGETTGGTYYATTEQAKLNANGSIGGWSGGTSLTSTQSNFGIANYGDKVYLLGGTIGGSISTATATLQMNNGGSGTAGTWSTSSNSLITARAFHAEVAYNNYLYVLGGTNGSSIATVEYASISGQTVGTWSTTTSLPSARQGIAAVAYNGYMYAMGGGNSSTLYTTISSNGALGASWTNTSNFIGTRAYFQAYANKGYMYLMGGNTGSTYYNDVQYAPISAIGTVGAWHYTHNSTDDGTTFVNGFTTGRQQFEGAVYGGYLYIIGGNNAAGLLADVQYAPLNADGTVGAWSFTTDLNGTRGIGAAFGYDGSICVLGGFTSIHATSGTATSNDVQCAQVGAGGTLSAWDSDINVFTTARSRLAAVVYNGTIYMTGGYVSTGPTYYADVQTANLDLTPKTALYTKLIDLGGLYNLSSVTYNGSISDASDITYRTAGTNGVMSADQTPASYSVASCTSGSVRYVWMSFYFDDSFYAAAPYSSNPSNLTDMTITYGSFRAQPNQRLYGGKFFKDETLQPLDTCGA